MANRITISTGSISAGATVSLMNAVTELRKLTTSTNDRNLSAIGISGATVNTGTLKVFVANEEVHQMINGVTNTTGSPVKQDDITPINELIMANEQLDVQVTNTTAGALSYYVYIELEE